MARRPDGGTPDRRPLVDDELTDRLPGKAQSEGVELLGPDGLLSQVTKAVLERALADEMTGHLGYDKIDPARRGSGNSREGTTPKTVLTDVGAVDLAVPPDRNGRFEPQIVRKGQTRLQWFNERIIPLMRIVELERMDCVVGFPSAVRRSVVAGAGRCRRDLWPCGAGSVGDSVLVTGALEGAMR